MKGARKENRCALNGKPEYFFFFHTHTRHFPIDKLESISDLSIRGGLYLKPKTFFCVRPTPVQSLTPLPPLFRGRAVGKRIVQSSFVLPYLRLVSATATSLLQFGQTGFRRSPLQGVSQIAVSY